MKNIKVWAMFGVMALALTACVKDLDTKPIDKKSSTAFNQDALFTKIYSTLATTGQQGPAGSADIEGADEGVSGFYRVMWELNEFPTDEGWWIWGDPGVDVARTMKWDGQNALVKMLYDRFIIVIKYCNHFLEYADTGGESDVQRAEVRFIRALNYWYMLDMFYVAPFIDGESFDNPVFKTRPELYAWLEAELDDLTKALPTSRKQTYRVDQTAAWLLLARLRLNAPVYTSAMDSKGNANNIQTNYDGAIYAADRALNSSYHLHTTSKTNEDGIVYTPYQQLFMGDNDINGAQNEAVLLVYQDGNYCRTYCGAQFAIAATRDGGMTPWGCSANWKCFRSSPQLVYKFVSQMAADTIKADEYHMREYAHDDRAILCSYVEGNPNTWKLSGGMAADFYASWACPKFTALYSTAAHISDVTGSHSEWADTDIPLMRIAEAYLIKAEAMFRKGDVSEAMDVINNSIRKRANAKPLETLDEMTLLDEWCREFWGEGRRRTDLIRFDRFAGAKADNNNYHWEGRNSSNAFTHADEQFNWFPIPTDDKVNNPNFKNQVKSIPGILKGGDGYEYE